MSKMIDTGQEPGRALAMPNVAVVGLVVMSVFSKDTVGFLKQSAPDSDHPLSV